MALRDKVKNWEAELEKVRKAKAEAIEKFDKKEKELIQKIDEAKEKIENENNKVVGDIVREMYGELSEENILKFKDFMKKNMGTSFDTVNKL